MTEHETMAHAIKYLILFGMVTCNSAERSIRTITGEICLRTAVEFPNKCFFTVPAVQTYFKSGQRTCRSKCGVEIYRDYGYMFTNAYPYSFRTFTVIFGNKSATNYTCTSSSYPLESHIRINCSSWKHDDYHVEDKNTCQERGAYCAYIGKTCICPCPSGYIMVNGHCLLANVHVGYTCSSDLQCTGTDYAGDCSNGVCNCHRGYLQINGICYPEDVPLNEHCTYNHQCSASPYAACLEGTCKCIDGYKAQNDGHCGKENQSFGGLCSQNDQCSTTICRKGRCVCRSEYVFIDDDCYKRDVSLNQHCIYNHQCSASPYAACLDGTCKCIDGYKAQYDGHCGKEKASYGGFCLRSDQCTHSTVCENERCTCKQGFIFINSECHESVPLNRSCVHHMQCSESSYAACVKGKCDCIAGYIPANSSLCVLDAPGSTSLSTLGILFRGLFLGVFITAGIVFIIYHRIKSSEKRRPEPCISYTQTVYGLTRAAEFNHSGSSSPQNTMREVINIEPNLPPEYCNVSNKSVRQPRNEDIYNHLNEKEEREDSDNYDHACAATFDIEDSNLYNNVQSIKRIPVFFEESC
ncbi:uncharacterized protein LOC144627247 [Crassostrea virginica]